MKRRITEIAIMLLLVSLSFAALTALLFKIFPLGISLTQILEQRTGARGGPGSRAGGGMFDVKHKEPAAEQTAATLSEMGNDVKSKGAGSIAWTRARQGMKLRNHDAIQTFTQSSAQINFDRSNYLKMGSNSLVIIERVEQEAAHSGRRSSVVVVDGELQGHVSRSGGNNLNLNIATPSALVRTAPQVAAGPKTDFKVSINPDQSSTVVVFRGEAKVSAQGKTVRVRENTGVTVKPGQAPGEPTPLPVPPKLNAPQHEAVLHYRDVPQRISFSWSAGTRVSRYHLQLARDKGFQAVVLDRKVDEPLFVHGNLRKGEYFWRVSRIEDQIEGLMGQPLRFEVAQKNGAPLLQVSFPAGEVAQKSLVVAGSTTPGARVFVGGSPVAVDEKGAFSCRVPLRGCWTLVTVEAVDALGNASYQSRYVRGRF